MVLFLGKIESSNPTTKEAHAMARLPQQTHFENELSSMIHAFLQTFRVSSLLRVSGAYKQSGIPVAEVFQKLFSLAFSGRSLFMALTCSFSDIGKDTFYRFVNSCKINWFKFLSLLSATVINSMIAPATDEKRGHVFIVDDTLYTRGRSKKVELLSWVHDHTKHLSVLGFRLLTLGWSDGNTFLPVNGCLLASKTRRFDNQRELLVQDKRSCGYRRRRMALSSAPEIMLEMLRQAMGSGIHASYVLFDSWFSSPKTVLSVVNEGLDVITMVRKKAQTRYLHNGHLRTIEEIHKCCKKRPGRAKYFLSVEVWLNDKKKCCSTTARLVFVRSKQNAKDYRVLLSTNTTLPEEEIIRLYGKRWSIEVFFKVCKSYLKLTGECRSLSFDAMTAYVAIVFARYMMLATERRVQMDSRTFGELFYGVCDELPDISWCEAFRILMEQVIETLSGRFSLTERDLELLFEDFMSTLPKELKSKLQTAA